MQSIPPVINHYKIKREIGKGASGTVFLCIDTKTNKPIALKAIPLKTFHSAKSFNTFLYTLSLLKNLNHKNIVKILSHFSSSNFLYIALEYSNGGDLYDYLKSYKKNHTKPLNEQTVRNIISQVAKGLEYMHKSNIMHRDIKLENILINYDDIELNDTINNEIKDDTKFTIKIADFGYATELQKGAMASDVCGTPMTMAPDVFIGPKVKRYDSSVDLWSLGAITFELLIGRPPFYSDNYKEIFEEILKGKYVYPSDGDVSIESISFINGLLQFEASKRMTWEQINEHPFIKNEVTSFHKVNLEINCKNENLVKFEVDSHNCENFLWLIYKDNNKIGIQIDNIYNYNSNVFNSEIDDRYYEDKSKLNIIYDYLFLEKEGSGIKEKGKGKGEFVEVMVQKEREGIVDILFNY